MPAFDCERLDTTYFSLRGLGQKPRFSALPPLIEFGHCRTWLQGCQISLEKKSQTMSEKKPNRVKKAKLLNKHKI